MIVNKFELSIGYKTECATVMCDDMVFVDLSNEIKSKKFVKNIQKKNEFYVKMSLKTDTIKIERFDKLIFGNFDFSLYDFNNFNDNYEYLEKIINDFTIDNNELMPYDLLLGNNTIIKIDKESIFFYIFEPDRGKTIITIPFNEKLTLEIFNKLKNLSLFYKKLINIVKSINSIDELFEYEYE